MKKLLFASFILVSSYSPLTSAQDEKIWKASVGVGVAAKKNQRFQNRYEDMDKNILIKTIPFITGSIGRLSLGGQGISFMALGNRFINGSVFINRQGDRYQGDNMAPRKDSAFVGASAKFMKYGLSVSRDINGRSKGWSTQVSYGEFFVLNESVMLRAGLALDWNDDRYAEYYYGVRKTEATNDRREYHLSNYFLPSISFMPIYKIAENVSLTSAINFKLLPKDVADSPTMKGNRLDVGGIIGISYQL